MGFACWGPAANVTVARPSAASLASNPMRRATGTSFVFARVLKSGFMGVSGVLMTFPPGSTICVFERSFQDIFQDGGRLHRARQPFFAVGYPRCILPLNLLSG